MRQYLETELSRREDERKALDARVAVLDAEIALLKDILARAPDEGRGYGGDARYRRPQRGPSRSGIAAGAGFSEKWAIVRDEAVRRHPDCIANEDVAPIQRHAGFEAATGANIRSHFYGAVKAGLYERVRPGVYRATQKAASAAGFPLGEGATKNDEPSPVGANGSVAGEGEDAQPSPPSLWRNP